METVDINNLNDLPTLVAVESLPHATQDMIGSDVEPIYELRPGLKRCAHKVRYSGNQCQLAEGHVLRHSWEPSAVEHVAAIEAADYETYLAYCSGVASELTDGVCPECGAEDLPW